jgi:hypothetical protein
MTVARMSMARNERGALLKRIVFLLSFFLFTFYLTFVAHTQSPNSVGVLRLKVRYKSAEGMKDLPRKRFFLFPGSLEQNKSLVDRIRAAAESSRECYYRNHGASAALIKWLKDGDCETLYCREIEEKYIAGVDAVPEFQKAFEQALNELKNRELARRWLTNYLLPEIRSGFYDQKRKTIQAVLSGTGAAPSTNAVSIMTDRKGSGYLTNIEPGTYTISNVMASETDRTSILWICEREVKATDLGTAMKRPMILSNEKDPKVTCEVIERPLPACNQ